MPISWDVTIEGQPMVAQISKYRESNVTAIQVFDAEGPYCRLTTCFPGVVLASDLVIVPDYNVDQDIIDQLVDQKFWQNTGRTIDYDFGVMPIYRLLIPLEWE